MKVSTFFINSFLYFSLKKKNKNKIVQQNNNEKIYISTYQRIEKLCEESM